DAAAPGRRTLPARPGARGVQSRRCARLAGLSRHEPRDAPPDGGGGGGRNAAPRARQPRRLPQWARRGVAGFRTPRACAAHRRGVAQDHPAARSDRRTLRVDRAARAVSALPTPRSITLTASDGRALGGLLLEATSPHGALCINGATGFKREFYLKFAAYCALRGYHALVYDYRG